MHNFKKYTLIVFLSIIVSVLQQSIFANVTFFGISADMVLVFVICYSLAREDVESIIFALTCGLIKDALFPNIFGLNTIVYIVTAYILCRIEKKIYKDAILIPMLLTFMITVVKGLLYYAYLYTASIKFDFINHFMYVVPIEAILNSIVSIVVFRIVNKINKLKFMEQEWKF